MSQQIIDIGTGPGTGNGIPLRSAFDTINQNFTELYSSISSLLPSVTSVSGRTGPVILTVQDIVGINLYQIVPPPITSKGTEFDLLGQLAFDNDYIYYCVASYSNGFDDIWKRLAWSSDTW
mgnify:CR=1 FL=1